MGVRKLGEKGYLLQERNDGISSVKVMRRLANSMVNEVAKFTCRGVWSNGELRSATASSVAPQVMPYALREAWRGHNNKGISAYC